MNDDFTNYRPGLTSPAEVAEEIIADDATSLLHATRALYVGVQGDIRLELVGGSIVTLRNAQSGVAYPLRVKHVFATGTTATDLVGLR